MAKLYEQKLVRTEDNLSAQQNLTRARRLVTKLRAEAARSRNTLASLLGISPDMDTTSRFELAGELDPPAFTPTFADLEMTALQNRPEALDSGVDSCVLPQRPEANGNQVPSPR